MHSAPRRSWRHALRRPARPRRRRPCHPLRRRPPLPLRAARPALTTAAGVIDATDPDLVLTVRAGVQVSPAYLGSDDYEVGPDFAARLDYIRFPNGFEYGSGRAVGFRTGWGLRGSARYLGERNSDDHDEIEGLDDVDWSFELGLGVGYEQRNWRAFTDVRYGFVGHNAWVGEIGADGIAYPLDGLTLTARPAPRRSAPTPSRRPTSASPPRGIRRLGPRPRTTPPAACSAPGSNSARATSSTNAGASRARRAGTCSSTTPPTRRSPPPDRRTSTRSASASPAASASTSEPGAVPAAPRRRVAPLHAR